MKSPAEGRASTSALQQGCRFDSCQQGGAVSAGAAINFPSSLLKPCKPSVRWVPGYRRRATIAGASPVEPVTCRLVFVLPALVLDPSNQAPTSGEAGAVHPEESAVAHCPKPARWASNPETKFAGTGDKYQGWGNRPNRGIRRRVSPEIGSTDLQPWDRGRRASAEESAVAYPLAESKRTPEESHQTA